MAWLLARLTEHPESRFSERYLIANHQAGFEVLRDLRILRRLPRLGHGDSLVREGQVLTILEKLDGGFEAADEREPGMPAVELGEPDLVEWGVDLERFGLEVQRRNQLEGPVERVGDRLLLCGETKRVGLRLGFVLGFYPEPDLAVDQLQSLSPLLTDRFDRIVVAATGSSLTADAHRRLSRESVVVIGFDGSLVVDLERALHERVRVVPVVELSLAEEEEHAKLGFGSRDALFLSGQPEARRRTKLEINGASARMGDASFIPFLLLVVRLFETADGWTSEEDILGLEGVAATEIDNLLSRIREPFRSAPIGCEATAIIEKDRNRVRLSVHRRFVTYDRELLLKHRNPAVAKLCGSPSLTPFSSARTQHLADTRPGDALASCEDCLVSDDVRVQKG